MTQSGGLTPLWSRNGRELFYLNGAGLLVSAAVLPGATFTLGAQVPWFNASGSASNGLSLNYDVSPDGQRFLLLRPLAAATMGGKMELVQITNWASEMRAKLAGRRGDPLVGAGRTRPRYLWAMSAPEELPHRNALPVRVFRLGEEPLDDL